jgi:hypothetical protein
MQYDASSAGRDTQDDCTEGSSRQIHWGTKKTTAGEPSNKPTRGRQSNSLGSNETALLRRKESTLLVENKGNLLERVQRIHKNFRLGK